MFVRKPNFATTLLLGAACCALLATSCSDDGAPNDAGGDSATTDGTTSDGPTTDSPTADTTPAPDAPSFCKPPTTGLQEITGTPASPYFVRHPVSPSSTTPTVLFLPGGMGSKNLAQLTYGPWLSKGDASRTFRVVMPYAADGNLTDEMTRVVQVLDEVLACYGGDAGKVHLGGTSTGGMSAFALMLTQSSRFATLLGAPGMFAGATSDAALKSALTGKAVYNGYAENDDPNWKNGASATHNRLKGLGLDSTLAEFKGQGHILTDAFDESIFFSWWAAH
jgi:predicted esterase